MTRTPCLALVGVAAAAAVAAPGSAFAATDPVAGSVAVKRQVVQGDAVATFGRLVLEPTDRGYLGSLTVTVRNRGTRTGNFDLLIREPVAGSWVETPPGQFCMAENYDEPRVTYRCALPSPGVAPGARMKVKYAFRVLTTPRADAMKATGGRVAVADLSRPGAPVSGFVGFPTLFRSTGGSLQHPRAYRQDTLADSSIVVGEELHITRQPNGRWTGTLPVKFRWGGDAAHWMLRVDVTVDGNRAKLISIDPAEAPCVSNFCFVGGGQFMQGEERPAVLAFESPPPAIPGVVQASATVTATYNRDDVPEKDASDNTAQFRVRIG